MKNLLTLVKMQLKEKLNFKRLEVEGVSAFNILVSVVGAVLKFALVTAIFVAVLFAVNYLGLFSFDKTTPTTVMSIAFAIMMAASLVSCTINLTNSMYYSRDNAILLTLPCRPVQVFLSKLIIFYAYELKRSFEFIVPLFIAFYILHGYPLLAYLWLIICFVFISLFTVATATLISIPAMWISNIFRQNRTLQIGTLVAIVSAVVIALFYAISLIPENLDLLATMPVTLNRVKKWLAVTYIENFGAYHKFTLMFLGLAGKTMGTLFPFGATAVKFLILLGIDAVLLSLGLTFVLPLFYKMASTPFEYLKKTVKPRKNRVTHKKLSTFFTEMIITIKNPSRMFSNVGIMISIPLLTFFLNKVFFAMNTDEMGNNMIVAFNVLIILLVALNANTTAASIYSRDGRSAYLIKTQPTNPAIILFSKLLPDALFCLVSLLATLVVLIISSGLGVINVIILSLGLIFIYFAHLLYCAELDIMNPQYEIYATVGASDSNPNETKATLSAFIIAFLTGGASMLLLLDKTEAVDTIPLANGDVIEGLFIKIFLIGLAALIYRIWQYFSKIKLYYKEK
ncbi:MAG: hypothetical protein E7676_02985 [Ruminococcaceae bacterium]|nr:hypothetical protein [Oscillospiraceae bacterium]